VEWLDSNGILVDGFSQWEFLVIIREQPDDTREVLAWLVLVLVTTCVQEASDRVDARLYVSARHTRRSSWNVTHRSSDNCPRLELWIVTRAVIRWVTPTTAFLMRQLTVAWRLGRTEYQLLLMKISWWDRNVKIRYKCLVVIDEFLTVSLYQPNESISRNHDFLSSAAERLDFMVQGKINRGRHTDHLDGRHSIRTNQCPPPPSHFLQAECPSCRPTNSVKALKVTSAFGLGRS